MEVEMSDSDVVRLVVAEVYNSGVVGLMVAKICNSGVDGLMVVKICNSGTTGLRVTKICNSGTIGLMVAEICNSGTVGLMVVEVGNSGTIGLMVVEICNSGTIGLMVAEVCTSGTIGLMVVEICNSGIIGMTAAEVCNLGTIELMVAEICNSGTIGLMVVEVGNSGTIGLMTIACRVYNSYEGMRSEGPEASISGSSSSGIPSSVGAKSQRDLEVMKSCHDVVSVINEEALEFIWECYSIPEEYAPRGSSALVATLQSRVLRDNRPKTRYEQFTRWSWAVQPSSTARKLGIYPLEYPKKWGYYLTARAGFKVSGVMDLNALCRKLRMPSGKNTSTAGAESSPPEVEEIRVETATKRPVKSLAPDHAAAIRPGKRGQD
ncbi:hypothetical protein B296_00052546 [Ensete ventricosum]|uniref:Uncharacterized protein n=1 Tax=Ensete ventricosum TaxID=4639 RepID=A0A426YBZ0_ENSVE|nr:hypothetical protein B296_00052546 [Ensete ventricosum]